MRPTLRITTTIVSSIIPILLAQRYAYDADGNRVKGTVGGVTTVYIGGLYEYSGGANTRYYTGPSGVVAMRRTSYASGNGVFYLLSDQLNSTSRIVNSAGVIQSTQYYYPYGGNRGGAYSSLTTKRFTGQYHEASIPGGEGLSYYNARWYDAKLGRFISADTLVPSPGNPQTLNRYSYVYNNPLRYSDPSGHCPLCIVVGIVAVSMLGQGGSTSPIDAGGNYTPGLRPYRQGAVEVRQNRATIEALATDQVPGILLAASIANQGNAWTRPMGSDWAERIQIFTGEHHQFENRSLAGFFNNPSVGVGQIMPGEAEDLGYEGNTWGLLDDRTSIGLMAAKLQATAEGVEKLKISSTESFILLAIGNNIGSGAAGRYGSLPERSRNIQTLLRNDQEAGTQLLTMMKWMGYLHANDGWAFPAGVDTGHIWHMLQNAYQ